MKHIVKQPEPPELSAYKTAAKDDYRPTYTDLTTDDRRKIQAALMAEQGYICCYCEQRLVENDSHIEHFRPQKGLNAFPDKTLDYDNIFCSCLNELNRGDPRHCGHKKDDWFDEKLMVSPLDPTCEARFAFRYDGRIMAANENDNAAVETINRLGLDIPKLRDARKKAIEPFIDENLTDDDRKKFIAGYLVKDNEGRFGAFWTTIHFFENRLTGEDNQQESR